MKRRIFLLCLALFAAPALAMPSFTFIVLTAIRAGDPEAVAIPGGSVWTLGPAGEIYRNNVKQPGAASVLMTVGNSLYSKGKSSPSWWIRNSADTGWQSAVVNLDSLSATALAAPVPVAGKVAPAVKMKTTLGKAGAPD